MLNQGRLAAQGCRRFSTAWSIPYAFYDNTLLDIVAQTGTSFENDVFFKPDGTRMFVLGISAVRVYGFTLSTPWDISTAVYGGSPADSTSFLSETTSPTSLVFKSDGTKLFIIESATSAIFSYDLSVPWDVSTAVFGGSPNGEVQLLEDTSITNIFFKPGGTRMYAVGNANAAIYGYDLSVPWDVSTAVYGGSPSDVFHIAQDLSIMDISIRPDGKKMLVVGIGNNTVYSYDLAVAWDISTASYQGESLSVAAQTTFPRGIYVRDNGTKMYIVDVLNGKLYQYTL